MIVDGKGEVSFLFGNEIVFGKIKCLIREDLEVIKVFIVCFYLVVDLIEMMVCNFIIFSGIRYCFGINNLI